MSGDPPAPTPQESTAQMIDAYRTGLPGLMNVMNPEILKNEQAQLEASKVVSPQYAALQNEIYKMYGPDAARTTLEIAKIQDPEYYNTRAAQSAKIIDLLNNPVSETERAEMERALNRSNGAASPNAMMTTQNAMIFGNKGRNNLLDALDRATAAIPGMNSQKQGFTESRTTGAQTGMGNQTAGQSSNLMGNIGANTQAAMGINANRRSGFDRTMGAASSAAGIFGKLW